MDLHLLVGDQDIGGRVDEVTEDVARLGIGLSAHAAGQQAVRPLAMTSSVMSKSTFMPTGALATPTV